MYYHNAYFFYGAIGILCSIQGKIVCILDTESSNYPTEYSEVIQNSLELQLQLQSFAIHFDYFHECNILCVCAYDVCVCVYVLNSYCLINWQHFSFARLLAKCEIIITPNHHRRSHAPLPFGFILSFRATTDANLCYTHSSSFSPSPSLTLIFSFFIFFFYIYSSSNEERKAE